MNHGGRPAATRSTTALARSFVIAAAACALAAAPAAAYVLHPATSAPVTVKISTHPPAASAGTTAKFAWKTTGTGVKATCRLDSGAYASCSRSRSYTKLKDGAHTFSVRAKGGATTRSATYKWRVDTVAPTPPLVSGGTGLWTAAAVTIAAAGSTDTGGSGIASYQHRSSVNAGSSWSAAAAGASANVTANGTTWVQFRALDKAGNASPWAPASADPAAEAMVDTLPPSLPVLTGGTGTWQNVASVMVQPTGTPADAGSGFAGYEYRTSADGGATWSATTAGAAATIAAEGSTLVEFRSLDGARQRLCLDGPNGQVEIDRTPPTAPAAHRRVGVVAGRAHGHRRRPAGSADAGSGVTGYEYETSTNGGSTWSVATPGPSAAVSTQGTTLVRFAALDGVALASPWTQATVKLDLTAPSAPTVAGGSSTWSNAASATVTASGSTDSGGSGLSGYEYRSSTDGGTTWSAPTSGPSDTVSAEANTWVQLRSVDVAGNTSAWTPATQTAGATVKLDRTAPATPVASGGSAGWSNAASVIDHRDGDGRRKRRQRATSTRPRPTAAPPGRRRRAARP